jgi:hypothetical protein
MRAVAALTLIACLSGCATPRAAEPLAESVELLLRDERPAARDEPGSFLFGPLWPWPLIPFYFDGSRYFPDRSLTPELTAAVRELNLFPRVVGAGDPAPARAAAPYVLEITLVETRRTETETAYGLGAFSVLLYALGAPMEYERTVIELRARCGPRGAAARASGQGAASDVALGWVYGQESRAPLEGLVREALAEALAELFE